MLLAALGVGSIRPPLCYLRAAPQVENVPDSEGMQGVPTCAVESDDFGRSEEDVLADRSLRCLERDGCIAEIGEVGDVEEWWGGEGLCCHGRE